MRPGAPSETTSSGARRPRAMSPLRNPAQARRSTPTTPPRGPPTPAGPLSSFPRRQHRLGPGAVVHLEVAAVEEQVLEGDVTQVPALPGVELSLDRLADP